MEENKKKVNEVSKVEEKREDILDTVRMMEKAVKAQMLIKSLTTLKKLAHDILVSKEKCSLLLKEIGLSEEDAKRVIDFINNAPSVKLSEKNLKDCECWAKSEADDYRKDSEKKVEEQTEKKMLHSCNLEIGNISYNTQHNGDNLPFLSGAFFNSSTKGTRGSLTPDSTNYVPTVSISDTNGEELKISI